MTATGETGTKFEVYIIVLLIENTIIEIAFS